MKKGMAYRESDRIRGKRMEIRVDRATKLLLFLILLALLANLFKPSPPTREAYAELINLGGGIIVTDSPTLFLWKVEGNRGQLLAKGEAGITNLSNGEIFYRWFHGREDRNFR